MSEHRAWGGRDDGLWWPGAIATDQQTMQQHLMQQHIQQQIDAANSTASNTQQMFTYKMASSFQNLPTDVTNSNSTSPVGAAGIRGYDYSMTGGNPTMSAPAPAAQWWYPPSTMDNMQNLQNNMHNVQSPQQQMPPVQNSPPPSQEDAQRHQEVANRQHQEAVQRHQEVQRQHQEAERQQEFQRQHQEAQRQHQEAQRQHQEAIQQHHQAIAEAQARQQQLQQQTHQLQQQLQHNQLHNNHQQHQQVLQQHQQISSPAPLPHKGRMPRAKGDSRPRGRMTAYAFFVQTCREEHKKKHPEENVVFAEFSKKCAERWKTMLDKEKKRFHEMAETDKKRYDEEMSTYTPPKGEKQRGKKRKQTKDPNAPKRSLSAFFLFSNDERGKVKAQNPEYGVGDIAKELGRRWADAAPEDKGRYEALADNDKARYEKEMTAYKKKNNAALQQAQPVPEPEEPEEDEELDEDD
ncbi:hypothetical protein JTB14_013003 [Gonioctena quinquepunctata]|nr:hypothetical protein JTB14_013003 [Gonioctena quinquepunctata]